jgi:hypothetical protein
MTSKYLVTCTLALLTASAFAQTETRSHRAARPANSTSSTSPQTPARAVAGPAVAISNTPQASSSATSATLPTTSEADALDQNIKESTTTADLRIGYSLSAPSGYYNFDGSTLSWAVPAPADTHYLGVTVQDARNKWHLPGCKVSATITDSTKADTSITLQETWDPNFRHYGSNISIPPAATTGTLAIKVEPGTMRRRDKVLGAFFTSAATATFTNVDLSTATLSKSTTQVEPERPIWPTGRRPYTTPIAR